MEHPLDLHFLEKVLKAVNASIYIINFEPFKIEWINNSMPFMAVSGVDSDLNQLIENSDFIENVTDVKTFFIQNTNRRWHRIFKMKKRDKNFRWILATAVVFEKNLKGIPQKAIATALDVTELFDSDDSLAMALGNIQQSRHKKVLELLTKKEKEIIRLLTKGYNTKEIARQLKRSFHTIETHRGNIKNKLGCKNVAEIPEVGQRLGLVI